MGSDLAAARDFLEVHERLHDDLMEKSDDIKTLSRVAEDLAKSGDKVNDCTLDLHVYQIQAPGQSFFFKLHTCQLQTRLCLVQISAV